MTKSQANKKATALHSVGKHLFLNNYIGAKDLDSLIGICKRIQAKTKTTKKRK